MKICISMSFMYIFQLLVTVCSTFPWGIIQVPLPFQPVVSTFLVVQLPMQVWCPSISANVWCGEPLGRGGYLYADPDVWKWKNPVSQDRPFPHNYPWNWQILRSILLHYPARTHEWKQHRGETQRTVIPLPGVLQRSPAEVRQTIFFMFLTKKNMVKPSKV